MISLSYLRLIDKGCGGCGPSYLAGMDARGLNSFAHQAPRYASEKHAVAVIEKDRDWTALKVGCGALKKPQARSCVLEKQEPIEDPNST